MKLQEIPNLLKEWDYEKNLIDPKDIKSNSHKKVWWKCPVADDHNWQASIQNRVKNKSKCPCCCNRKVVKSNCLETTHPKLCKEWSSKNFLTPKDITAGYSKKVWWQCLKHKEHIWNISVINRTRNGNGCPYCYNRVSITNNLVNTYPDLCKEWSPKNKIKPNEVCCNSVKKVLWLCENGHEWETFIQSRTNGKRKVTGCPFCSGKKINFYNSIFALYPKICEEWYSELNNLTPDKVSPQSHKKFWWICSKDKNHKWLASPNNRVSKLSGCPFCKKTSSGEMLIRKYLNDIEISYSEQYKINGCKHIRLLPFDFAIHFPKLGLIEFQGGQHFKSVSIFGGTKAFKNLKKRDLIKENFCKENKIPLLKINFNEIKKIPNLISCFIDTLRKA